MAVAKYLARHCYLVFAILCWSSIVVGTAANVPCSCVVDGPRKATLVLADGASGSTWLGQMLDNHPCSSAFVHNSTRLDGKAYIKCVSIVTVNGCYLFSVIATLLITGA